MNNIFKRIVVTTILFFAIGMTAFKVYKTQILEPQNNQSTVTVQKKASVIYFYRNDCVYCKRVFPIVKILSSLKLPVQYVNTNNRINRMMAKTRYKISAVPTFIVIDKNGNEKGRYSGSDFKKIKKLFIKNSN